MTLRRAVAWLVAVSLTFAGTFATHCYLLPGLAAPQHAAHEGTTSMVGFLCAAPFLLTCVTLLGLALATRGVGGVRLTMWPFGVLAPVGFLLHQYFAGFTGAISPSITSTAFLLGLALQIPLGLLAYLAARALLGVADRISAALALRRTRVRLAHAPAAAWNTTSRNPLAVLLTGGGVARAPPLTGS